MQENLQRLADALGIVTHYSDAGLNRKDYYTSDEVVNFFVKTFGYKSGNEAEIAESLEKISRRRWQTALENIYVVEQGHISFDIVLPVSAKFENVEARFKYDTTKGEFNVPVSVIPSGEEKNIGRNYYQRLVVVVNAELEVGYYDVSLTIDGKTYKTRLAVAPKKCYTNEALEEQRLWGFALQLYSVRSDRNWGVGDFTDLRHIVAMCKRAGADIIGLNPLNVLSHDYPENASPYCATSRLYLNPIYIDIEAVPEFRTEDLGEIAEELSAVRNSELIDYKKVYELKIKMLEKFYQRFLSDASSHRHIEFDNFCKEQGADLERLAIYQTIYEEKNPTVWGGWRAWEEDLRNSGSLKVKEYAKKNAERIGFFKFLQFETARQFDLVYVDIVRNGLKVGLYRDLAVGVSQDSAEVWSNNEVYLKDSGAGAPPDAFFSKGQKWCLGAFNPYILKEQCYEPFINILRANMHNAGALRIDHVMGLMRLFIIPNEMEAGTYIMYNFADMLNILAIESYLNRCVIVGESIGNVPEGFLETIEAKNVNSLSVLWAERWCEGAGDFKSPYDYPSTAFTSIGTHDMPPLKVWWFGNDIEERFRLGMIDEASKNAEYHARELDRWKLLFALDSNGVWPEDNPRKANYIYGEGYPEGLVEAVNRFVARSSSKVFLSELENILYVDKMQNLPGTFREHPNWQRKLPVPLERLEEDIAYIRAIRAIRKER